MKSSYSSKALLTYESRDKREKNVKPISGIFPEQVKTAISINY